MSEPLTREELEHTLNLIVDHSLRAWKSCDEIQMILDHDALQRQQLAMAQAQWTATNAQYESAAKAVTRLTTALREAQP